MCMPKVMAIHEIDLKCSPKPQMLTPGGTGVKSGDHPSQQDSSSWNYEFLYKMLSITTQMCYTIYYPEFWRNVLHQCCVS